MTSEPDPDDGEKPRSTIWMFSDFSDNRVGGRDLRAQNVLGPGPLVTFVEDIPQSAGDRELAEQVLVTSEQVVRWRHAEETYRAALDEMRQAYEAAAATSDALHQIIDDAEAATAQEQAAEWKAKEAAAEAVAEAEADLRDGPREWITVARTKHLYPRRKPDYDAVVGWTLHRVTCAHAAEGQGRVRSKPIRLPEARSVAAEATYDGCPLHVCKNCARDLRRELSLDDPAAS